MIGFDRYGSGDQGVPLIASFGGRHLTRGGGAEFLEGSHMKRRAALFEFPSMDTVHAFWNSPEHVPMKEFRRDAATLDVLAVPGA